MNTKIINGGEVLLDEAKLADEISRLTLLIELSDPDIVNMSSNILIIDASIDEEMDVLELAEDLVENSRARSNLDNLELLLKEITAERDDLLDLEVQNVLCDIGGATEDDEFEFMTPNEVDDFAPSLLDDLFDDTPIEFELGYVPYGEKLEFAEELSDGYYE